MIRHFSSFFLLKGDNSNLRGIVGSDIYIFSIFCIITSKKSFGNFGSWVEIGKQFFFLKQSGKYLYYRSSLKSISKNKLYFFFFVFGSSEIIEKCKWNLNFSFLLKSAVEICWIFPWKLWKNKVSAWCLEFLKFFVICQKLKFCVTRAMCLYVCMYLCKRQTLCDTCAKMNIAYCPHKN